MPRSPWLERHDEFEGVGAHELNPRYDHVDGGDWDEALRDLVEVSRRHTPALFDARGFVSLVPIRFDGADISHYQDDAGPIVWRDLRDVSWWIATKATQSIRSIDPTFGVHWSNMRALDFTHRLAYHWLSSTTSPEEQAAHYLRTVGPFLEREGAMLDAEEGGITVDKCLAWCEYVEAVTHRPVSVYSGAYVAGGTIWQSTAMRTSKYGPRPMHLAAYTTEAKAKALPGVKAYPWSAWQYSSNGPVAGIVGRCDMNRVDNVAAYDLACGVKATPLPGPQPPQEDDMATAFFEVEGLPGQYMWTPGSNPIPFTNPADRDVLLKGLGVDPANGGRIGQDMYQRLFIPKASSAVDEVARSDAIAALEGNARTAGAISDIRIAGQRIADAGGNS